MLNAAVGWWCFQTGSPFYKIRFLSRAESLTLSESLKIIRNSWGAERPQHIPFHKKKRTGEKKESEINKPGAGQVTSQSHNSVFIK